jgi:uncharacterized protein YlxW (UPF0749 family)
MIRDRHSKALIETDAVELQRYRNEKKREKEMSGIRTEIQSIRECVNNLYNKIKEIENKI